MLKINQLYHGNSAALLSQVDTGSVSLVVTSPPYKEKDGYSEVVITSVFSELYRAQKESSLFFLNFGHLAEDKFRPFRVCNIATQCGYKLAETFVWIKNHYKPIQGSRRVNNLSEFVFMLSKGSMPIIDRLSIGIPYVDISNAKRFNKGRNLRCRGNVWEIPYKTINDATEKIHPDRFPVQLPEFCIKLSNIPKGSLVIDPFMGSGTTIIAAKNLGMSYLGFDREQHWVDVARNRLIA